MAESDKKKWWQTLPAILTAVAAVLGSAAGLVSALWPAGISGPQSAEVAFGGDLVVTVDAEPEDPGEWHADRDHWHQMVPDEF